MTLHENTEQFKAAIHAASDHFSVREEFIEKDYWVTFILKKLSESEFCDQVVFKGGTSLSKVYNLVDRFSEDIDLALIKSGKEYGGEIKKLIRSIEKNITAGLEEVEIEGVTSKKGNYRKTAYEYSKVLDNYPGSGIVDNLILEINSFAKPVPYKWEKVASLISRFFTESNQAVRTREFGMNSFQLNVLVPESTLIEKILSVIRLSFYKDNIEQLKKKVRHFYDIYFLSRSESGEKFLNSDDFTTRFKSMLEEDKGKFTDPVEWLEADYKAAPVLNEFDKFWDKIKSTYNSDFKDLVHGKFPDEKEIANQFRKIISILKK